MKKLIFILKSFALMFVAMFLAQVVIFSLGDIVGTGAEYTWDFKGIFVLSFVLGLLNTWVPMFVLVFMGEKK